MSIRLRQLADWSLLPTNERYVLSRLADYADDDGGNCYPSQATLAASTGLPERTLRRCLGRLIAEGYITPLVRPHRQSVRYRIEVARLEASQHPESPVSGRLARDGRPKEGGVSGQSLAGYPSVTRDSSEENQYTKQQRINPASRTTAKPKMQNPSFGSKDHDKLMEEIGAKPKPKS